MSVQYGAISWNRQKKIYDIVLVGCLRFTSVYLLASEHGGTRMQRRKPC